MFLQKRAKTLDGGLFKGLTVLGMGDLDEFDSTLAQVLAKEISDTVLGDDKVDVGSGRDHTSSGLEEWHDLALTPFVCGSSTS